MSISSEVQTRNASGRRDVCTRLPSAKYLSLICFNTLHHELGPVGVLPGVQISIVYLRRSVIVHSCLEERLLRHRYSAKIMDSQSEWVSWHLPESLDTHDIIRCRQFICPAPRLR